MNRGLTLFALCWLLVILPPLLAAHRANADTIRLRNGRELVGEILDEDDSGVLFRSGPSITARIPRSSIAGLTRGAVPVEVRERRERRSDRARRDEGHGQSCPRECDACEELFEASIERICSSVRRRHPLSPLPVGGGSWIPLQATSAAVLGLVLIGEGNTPSEGPHAAALSKLVRYVVRTGVADNKMCRQFRVWILSLSALFLAELQRVAPDDDRMALLRAQVDLLEAGLVTGKGWRHSLRGQPGGYGPFVAITVWCVAALGAAKEVGVEVDPKVLAEGRKALSRSLGQRRRGAWYYADRWTQIHVGRTSGVLWALIRHCGRKAGDFDRARRFIEDRSWATPHGHASGMMNLAWGALGAAALGEESRDRFFDRHRRTILLNREESGLFDAVKWRDLGYFDFDLTRQPFEGRGTTWPDHVYGKGWATPWMLLTWQVGRGRSILGEPAEPRERER